MGKFRYPVVIGAFGLMMKIFGTILKIMHWSGALFFTTFSYPLLIIASFWIALLVFLLIITGKYRYPVIIFLTSFFAVGVDLFFRTMYWSGGELIVGAMFVFQAIAIVWFVVLLLQKDKTLKS
jgi:hypothetical protein